MSRPLILGNALKEATVRDYQRNAIRAGLPIDMQAIERQAVADCQLVDAFMRDVSPRAPVAPDPAKAAEKAGTLDAMAAEQGATIIHDPEALVRKKFRSLSAVPKPDSRWSNALARMSRILLGITAHASRREACATAAIPQLAYELMRLHAFLITRHIPPTLRGEPNPFYGLSDADFIAKYKRLVEDVCDKSTGHPGFGSWRTPK